MNRPNLIDFGVPKQTHNWSGIRYRLDGLQRVPVEKHHTSSCFPLRGRYRKGWPTVAVVVKATRSMVVLHPTWHQRPDKGRQRNEQPDIGLLLRRAAALHEVAPHRREDDVGDEKGDEEDANG